MYLIIVGYINGDVEYYGPFPTEERAVKYGWSIDKDLSPSKWFVKPLTVPYSTVVKRIEYV